MREPAHVPIVTYHRFVRADAINLHTTQEKWVHFSTIAPKGTATLATCAGAGVRSTMLQTRSLEGKLTSSSQRVPRGVRTATEKDFSGPPTPHPSAFKTASFRTQTR